MKLITKEVRRDWTQTIYHRNGTPPLRKRSAPSRHSGDSSLSPNDPSSSLTMMSAFSGGSHVRMSHDTTVTKSPHSSYLRFSNLATQCTCDTCGERNCKFQKNDITLEVGVWVQISWILFSIVPNWSYTSADIFGVVYHVYFMSIYVVKGC